MIKNLVLSGGGIKGIAHLGALKALEEKHILQNIKVFAGTSIGAFICCLLIIGYSPVNLFDFFKMFDFNVMLIKKFKIRHLMNSFGFDSGKKLECLINTMFLDKGFINPTFRDLFYVSGKTLFIVATCISDRKPVYFSHLTHPNMPVILALKMALSIPVYFAPVLYEGKYYVDGGCMNNYPIELFKYKTSETIGIYLFDKFRKTKINNIFDMLIGTYQSISNGISKLSISNYKKNTIKIPVYDVCTLEINITQEDKEKLYELGHKQTIIYCKSSKLFKRSVV